MSLQAPGNPDPLDSNNTSAVEHLSAVQLIQHTHHEMRAPITSTIGLSELLTNGTFGFANSEQQELIEQIQGRITAVTYVYQDMLTWLAARVGSDGNWISDDYGTHPTRLHQTLAQHALPPDAATQPQD